MKRWISLTFLCLMKTVVFYGSFKIWARLVKHDMVCCSYSGKSIYCEPHYKLVCGMCAKNNSQTLTPMSEVSGRPQSDFQTSKLAG